MKTVHVPQNDYMVYQSAKGTYARKLEPWIWQWNHYCYKQQVAQRMAEARAAIAETANRLCAALLNNKPS